MKVTQSVIDKVEAMVSQQKAIKHELESLIAAEEPLLKKWISTYSSSVGSMFDSKVSAAIKSIVESAVVLGYIVAETANSDEFINRVSNDSKMIDAWLSGQLSDEYYEPNEYSEKLGPLWDKAVENHKAVKAAGMQQAACSGMINDFIDHVRTSTKL